MKKCFICASDAQHYCNWEEFEYIKCNKCDLVYVNQNFKESDVIDAYTGGSLKDIRRKIVAPFRKFEHFKIYKEKMATTKQIMDVAIKHTKPEPGAKMLDIGCNKGFLLAQGVNYGFEPYGVEIVQVLMAQFKKKFKQFKKNIFAGNFTDINSNFSDNQFDLITAIDVVEHLQEPRRDFENIYRVLKKGGSFLVQTPDTESKTAKEKGADWGDLKAYEHLQLFNKENLTLLSKQIGFDKIEFYEAVEVEMGHFIAVLIK